ncbi:flavonol 4'-sulfotransferase-like [Rutidosis leptorrhynchoides]|uniref:flavonol 4'-sulfotransferase-like n=1 Tax=Rutidosis leptorrhynchoides TaxID=125765 RepID=UPI003A996468
MEEMFNTLPKHSCTWLKGNSTWYKYQNFWTLQRFHLGAILAQQNLKAQPSDILVCSYPKTGTTWLKALSFAIVTRQKFDKSANPLLTTFPHDCMPFLETDLDLIEENRNKSPLISTHLPYQSLPESTISSNCKIVYIYRNVKDVIVSQFHFLRGIHKLPMDDSSFEEAFDDFCQGISGYGPYWEHILGYWNASLERPGKILFLKYEDLKRDPTSNLIKLAEFLGSPFSDGEVKDGVVENIIKLCSFENLSNLDVNKNGLHNNLIEKQIFFRKAKDGDWKNYFTDEMKEKIDNLVDEKLKGTNLVLK